MKTVNLGTDPESNLTAIMKALGVKTRPVTHKLAQQLAEKARKKLQLMDNGKETRTNRDWILWAANRTQTTKVSAGGDGAQPHKR